MRRREFIAIVGGAATAWPLAARAQQAQKSYRVAYLALAGDQDAVIVRHRLADLGYAEGKNLIFDFRSAEGHLERLPQLAADLVKTNPDLIVAGFRDGDRQGGASRNREHTCRVHQRRRSDRVRHRQEPESARRQHNRSPRPGRRDWRQAAANPGGAFPGIRIVAVLLEPDAPFTTVALPELKSAADARGGRLEICEVRTADRLATSVEAAAEAGATGLMMLETPLLLDLRRQIVDLAAKLRLAAIYNNREFVEAGGLLSYGADRRQLYRRAAELVDKI